MININDLISGLSDQERVIEAYIEASKSESDPALAVELTISRLLPDHHWDHSRDRRVREIIEKYRAMMPANNEDGGPDGSDQEDRLETPCDERLEPGSIGPRQRSGGEQGSRCDGAAQEEEGQEEAEVEEVECSDCRGTGAAKPGGPSCENCGGWGKLRRSDFEAFTPAAAMVTPPWEPGAGIETAKKLEMGSTNPEIAAFIGRAMAAETIIQESMKEVLRLVECGELVAAEAVSRHAAQLIRSLVEAKDGES